MVFSEIAKTGKNNIKCSACKLWENQGCDLKEHIPACSPNFIWSWDESLFLLQHLSAVHSSVQLLLKLLLLQA